MYLILRKCRFLSTGAHHKVQLQVGSLELPFSTLEPAQAFIAGTVSTVKMSMIFGWCGPDKFKHRCVELLRIAPETFLCGFLWTGFSLASGCGTYSVLFYFSAGFGSGMGALVGHALMNSNIDRGFPTISRQELFHSVAYFFAIFLGSGTT